MPGVKTVRHSRWPQKNVRLRNWETMQQTITIHNFYPDNKAIFALEVIFRVGASNLNYLRTI